MIQKSIYIEYKFKKKQISDVFLNFSNSLKNDPTLILGSLLKCQYRVTSIYAA